MGKYDSDGSWIADDGRRYDSPSADPNLGKDSGSSPSSSRSNNPLPQYETIHPTA